MAPVPQSFVGVPVFGFVHPVRGCIELGIGIVATGVGGGTAGGEFGWEEMGVVIGPDVTGLGLLYLRPHPSSEANVRALQVTVSIFSRLIVLDGFGAKLLHNDEGCCFDRTVSVLRWH
jgi:hypothetical protein